MKDTADEVGTVGDCLYSIGNRVEIAKILYDQEEIPLLETILEDIYRSIQDLFDEHCIKRD